MRAETLASRRRGPLGWLRITDRRNEAIVGWLMVVPVVIATLIFDVLPMVPSFYFSVHHWDGLSPMRWAGLENYATLVGEQKFRDSVGNTVTYVLGSVPVGILAGFLLALLVNQNLRGVTVFRGIYYLPVVSSTVAVGVVFQFLLAPQFGLINQTLFNVFGITGPNWLHTRPWAMVWLIFVSVWISMGYYMVLFLAGLQSIPAHLYEAATIDGANSLQKVRHVTLPLLSPTFFLILIIATIAAFNVFTLVMVLTEASSWATASSYNGTQALVVYLYFEALRNFRFGLGSAVAVLMFIGVGLLTLLNWKLNQRWVFYGG
ncbi:MAG: sugar ABC transporter permease [Chloroflexi bacterium]|nr:sugar ABC transporter permease [Chloroflexota bacterium]